MQWQRRLRIGLGVFLVALIAVVALTLRSREPEPSGGLVPRADPSASVEATKGGELTWTEKDREVFTLKFDRNLTYADGRSVFSGVTVRIPDRGGRSVDIRADEAEVSTTQGANRTVQLRGNVVLSTSDNLTLKAPRAQYSETDRILRIPGAFTFARPRMTGSGEGALYDQNADLFTILSTARVDVAPDAAGAGAMSIRSGRAQLDRGRHLARFEERAHVTSGSQTTESDLLVAYLAEDEQTLTRVELRGNSQVSDSAAAAGALRGMRAQDIDLLYAPDGRTLQRAELRTGSVMEIAGAGAASRRLAAQTIDVQLGPDGQGLQQLTARDHVQLDLPPEGDTGARRIQSSVLTGTGGAEGLRDVTFTGAVQYREIAVRKPAQAGAPPGDRIASADRLDATLAPGLGAPETAVFRGGVSIQDGTSRGEAGLANYSPARNVMTLETPDGATGPTPRVTDDQVTVSARWIEMTLEPKRLLAKGDVRSVLQSAPRGGQGPTRQRPAMLQEKEPVNVTAAQLEYDAARAQGTYTGTARLWQGETTIHGETIVLDDTTGNLLAKQAVRTRMLLEQANEKTGKTEMVESLGSADDFAYSDEARRATYTGKAHLTGPQGDVTANRIEIYLHADGRTLQRAEAYEQVVARLEGGQQAFGARLTYYAADGRYVMTGSPVKVLEIVEDGCRETVGVSLTFTRSTDTINVVGTEGNRSRTMPGRCTERAVIPRAQDTIRH